MKIVKLEYKNTQFGSPLPGIMFQDLIPTHVMYFSICAILKSHYDFMNIWQSI